MIVDAEDTPDRVTNIAQVADIEIKVIFPVARAAPRHLQLNLAEPPPWLALITMARQIPEDGWR